MNGALRPEDMQAPYYPHPIGLNECEAERGTFFSRCEARAQEIREFMVWKSVVEKAGGIVPPGTPWHGESWGGDGKGSTGKCLAEEDGGLEEEEEEMKYNLCAIM